MPKKSMTDKDVEKTHKDRARTPRTSPDYPAKKEAHERAQERQAGRDYQRECNKHKGRPLR